MIELGHDLARHVTPLPWPLPLVPTACALAVLWLTWVPFGLMVNQCAIRLSGHLLGVWKSHPYLSECVHFMSDAPPFEYRVRHILARVLAAVIVVAGGIVYGYLMTGVIGQDLLLPADTMIFKPGSDLTIFRTYYFPAMCCLVALVGIMPHEEPTNWHRHDSDSTIRGVLSMSDDDIRAEQVLNTGDIELWEKKDAAAAVTYYLTALDYIARKTHFRYIYRIGPVLVSQGALDAFQRIEDELATRNLDPEDRCKYLDTVASGVLWNLPDDPVKAKSNAQLAKGWMEEALRLLPSRGTLHGTMGALCAELGEFEQARLHLQACIDAQDGSTYDDSVARPYLALTCAMLGELDAAEKLLRPSDYELLVMEHMESASITNEVQNRMLADGAYRVNLARQAAVLEIARRRGTDEVLSADGLAADEIAI